MRLPQIQSPQAVMFIAAAITIVTWIVVIWPGTETRRLPPDKPAASTQQPITYVDINMKDTQAPAPAAPARAPAP